MIPHNRLAETITCWRSSSRISRCSVSISHRL
jgi:hypothetical protein